MRQQSPTPIVLDASVLLNFVKIKRVELLGQLDTSVVLLDQVLDEVIRPEQREAVEGAVKVEILDLQSVRNPVEVALFASLRADGRLGAGRVRGSGCCAYSELGRRASGQKGAG